jgi:hypothetical protein
MSDFLIPGQKIQIAVISGRHALASTATIRVPVDRPPIDHRERLWGPPSENCTCMGGRISVEFKWKPQCRWGILYPVERSIT